MIEHVAVPIVAARFDRGVDNTSRHAPVLRVIDVGHHLKFLDGLDVGRDLPRAAVIGNGRTVQQKDAGAWPTAVDFVTVVGVPGPRSGKPARSELLLRDRTPGVNESSMYSCRPFSGYCWVLTGSKTKPRSALAVSTVFCSVVTVTSCDIWPTDSRTGRSSVWATRSTTLVRFTVSKPLAVI